MKAKTKKINTATTSLVPATEITGGNVWIKGMFVGFPTKVQNDPKFKDLTIGAQNLAGLIEQYVPPGNGQKEALQSLGTTFRLAAGEIANAVTLPSGN